MVRKRASAQWKGTGKKGVGSVTTQSKALHEQPYGFNTRFEGKTGTNPEELIAAAHSSCFAMALAFALSDKDIEPTLLDVSAVVTLEEDGDGFTVTRSALTLKAEVPGISAEDFAEVANGAKENCPISKLLNAEITLEHTLA